MLDREAPANPVEPDQLGMPTPCSEWDVQALLDHLVGGTEYLLAGKEGRAPKAATGTSAADHRAGVDVGPSASPQAQLLGAMGRAP